jgi:hypothetical protein
MCCYLNDFEFFRVVRWFMEVVIVFLRWFQVKRIWKKKVLGVQKLGS